MENYQFFTLVGMLAAGFAWTINWLRSIDNRIGGLEVRISVVETRIMAMENRLGVVEARMGFIERLLEMMGVPFSASRKEKSGQ